MIRTRDVTFDKLQKYHLNDLRIALINRIERLIQFIEFFDNKFAEGVNNV